MTHNSFGGAIRSISTTQTRGIFLLLLHSSLNMKLEGWLVAWCLCGGGVVVRPLACAGRHGRRRCELARVPTHLFTIHLACRSVLTRRRFDVICRCLYMRALIKII